MEYIEPFTDWGLTQEQGVSTADLNRMEKNLKNLKDAVTDRFVYISSQMVNLVENAPQFCIRVPAGYRLKLQDVKYYSSSGTSQSAREFIINNRKSASEEVIYFNSATDGGNQLQSDVEIGLLILNNDAEEDILKLFGTRTVGTFGSTATSYTIKFDLAPL